MAGHDPRPAQSVHLRTACDPCSNAKVRCDKKHPACDRCSHSNTACWYSESRKHGKQSRRKRLVAYDDRLGRQPRTSATSATTIATTMATTAPQPSAITTTTSPSGCIGRAGGTWNGLLPSPSSLPAMEMDSIEGDPVFESLLNGQDSGSRHGSTSSSEGRHNALSSWPLTGDMGMGMDMTSFADWQIPDIPCPISTASPASYATPGLHENPTQGPSPAYEMGEDAGTGRSRVRGFAPPKTNNATNTNPATNIFNTINNHDCEARAISILYSMQHGQVQQGMATCSAEPSRYPDFNLRPSFDRVLSTNKAALSGWGKLMECSCAQSPDLILLYVSILSKMLFWYRGAAIDTNTKPMYKFQSQQEEIEDSSSSSRIGLLSPPDTTASVDPVPPPLNQFGVVQPTLIRVGSLSLDAEEQANLRRVLLLGELRKTEKAIEELMAVDRTATSESPDASLRRAVQWGLSGISCVKQELHEVMQLVGQSR